MDAAWTSVRDASTRVAFIDATRDATARAADPNEFRGARRDSREAPRAERHGREEAS